MSEFNVDNLIAAIEACLPAEAPRPISLHEPRFGAKEREYVLECVDTNWVSSVGAYVDKFERQLESFTGIRHAVAVANGTAALHMALLVSGVKQGDEVLLPTLTFVATANAVMYCGAVPHFVDSDLRTLGVDVAKLRDYLTRIAVIKDGRCINKETGRTIACVLPMHTFGHPLDIEPLAELCEEFAITLVEDAAESLGSFYKGKHTGGFGLVAAMSFNGNKLVTTGGGGAILTDDDDLAKRAKHLTTTAKVPHKWEYVHDEVGYNYRLPNLNAALGVAQMERLDTLLAQKRQLAEKYRRSLAEVPGVTFVMEPEGARSNYWLNAILLDEQDSHLRDTVLAQTHAVGLLTRPAWKLLHQLPMYEDCPRMDVSTAEAIEGRLVNLPSSPWLVEA